MQTNFTIPVGLSLTSRKSEKVTVKGYTFSLHPLHSRIAWLLIRCRIFVLSLSICRKPWDAVKLFRSVKNRKKEEWGGNLMKLTKAGGKYFYSQYFPGWPSALHDRMVKDELRRMIDPESMSGKTTFIFFAITRKCPMRCEHCFEWDNLNMSESFTGDDLIKVVDIYRKQGVKQIHFSGGEPMVRIKDLLKVVAYASPDCLCWVLTSGFNLTRENARLLKHAGLTGVAISVDHYISELHNMFRGHKDSYKHAMDAIQHAKEAGLAVTITVCATKFFIEGNHMDPYMEFAREKGVQFVQVLEPRQVGHYKESDVLLDEKHILIMEEIFKRYNHNKAFANYPLMMYHGYHQRRVGCYAGGRSVYIDSAGDVHACPFCHTRSYNIIDIIRKQQEAPLKSKACPRYDKVA